MMPRKKGKQEKMFDLHTHILPGIDDGSRSVSESLAMLEELTRQGASGIAATPHFYAQRSSPERFFAKRQAAWEQLEPHLQPGTPEIRLGAEVQFFEGIHRFEALEEFCLEGTSLLLVEMPTCIWTTRMVSAILELSTRGSIQVVLAHIERYLQYRNKKAITQLLQNGVFMQVSTGFFIERPRKAMKMLREGKFHFLGTDSHNMTTRKPDLAPALEIISRYGGEQWLSDLEQREAAMLYGPKNSMDNLRGSSTVGMPADIH